MLDYTFNPPVFLSLDDVLLLPKKSSVNSRSEVDLSWSINDHLFSIPIISINMDCVTGVKMALSMGKAGGLGILPRFDPPEIQADKVKKVKTGGVFTAAAVGIKKNEWPRAKLLIKAGVDHLSVDVAHGHLEKAIRFVSKIRSKFKDISLSAGVVGTYSGAKDLFQAGADVVRVGVGPGTICTTRIVTGCGVPQLTALIEASRAARELGKTIWADGGTENSGDIAKCLAAGASAVIIGSQLAGTDEAASKLVEIKGKKYKQYNASTSAAEKRKQFRKYNGDKSESYLKHIEGAESLVPYEGKLQQILDQLIAGIRSGYSYCGAFNTKELWQKAEFIRVTSLGSRRNGPHNVIEQNIIEQFVS